MKTRLGSQIGKRRLQRHRQKNDEKDIRNRINDIHNTHHHQIHPAAEKSGNRTVSGTDDQDNTRRNKAHKQGNAAAHHHADGIVTPHLVRAENMREHFLARIDPGLLLCRILHGRKAVRPLDLLLVCVRIKSGNDKGKYHYHNNHNQRDHRHLIFPKPAHTVLPETHALAHDNLTLFFFLRSRQKIFRLEF